MHIQQTSLRSGVANQTFDQLKGKALDQMAKADGSSERDIVAIEAESGLDSGELETSLKRIRDLSREPRVSKLASFALEDSEHAEQIRTSALHQLAKPIPGGYIASLGAAGLDALQRDQLSAAEEFGDEVVGSTEDKGVREVVSAGLSAPTEVLAEALQVSLSVAASGTGFPGQGEALVEAGLAAESKDVAAHFLGEYASVSDYPILAAVAESDSTMAKPILDSYQTGFTKGDDNRALLGAAVLAASEQPTGSVARELAKTTSHEATREALLSAAEVDSTEALQTVGRELLNSAELTSDKVFSAMKSGETFGFTPMHVGGDSDLSRTQHEIRSLAESFEKTRKEAWAADMNAKYPGGAILKHSERELRKMAKQKKKVWMDEVKEGLKKLENAPHEPYRNLVNDTLSRLSKDADFDTVGDIYLALLHPDADLDKVRSRLLAQGFEEEHFATQLAEDSERDVYRSLGELKLQEIQDRATAPWSEGASKDLTYRLNDPKTGNEGLPRYKALAEVSRSVTSAELLSHIADKISESEEPMERALASMRFYDGEPDKELLEEIVSGSDESKLNALMKGISKYGVSTKAAGRTVLEALEETFPEEAGRVREALTTDNFILHGRTAAEIGNAHGYLSSVPTVFTLGRRTYAQQEAVKLLREDYPEGSPERLVADLGSADAALARPALNLLERDSIEFDSSLLSMSTGASGEARQKVLDTLAGITEGEELRHLADFNQQAPELMTKVLDLQAKEPSSRVADSALKVAGKKTDHGLAVKNLMEMAAKTLGREAEAAAFIASFADNFDRATLGIQGLQRYLDSGDEAELRTDGLKLIATPTIRGNQKLDGAEQFFRSLYADDRLTAHHELLDHAIDSNREATYRKTAERLLTELGIDFEPKLLSTVAIDLIDRSSTVLPDDTRLSIHTSGGREAVTSLRRNAPGKRHSREEIVGRFSGRPADFHLSDDGEYIAVFHDGTVLASDLTEPEPRIVTESMKRVGDFVESLERTGDGKYTIHNENGTKYEFNFEPGKKGLMKRVLGLNHHLRKV